VYVIRLVQELLDLDRSMDFIAVLKAMWSALFMCACMSHKINCHRWLCICYYGFLLLIPQIFGLHLRLFLNVVVFLFQ